MTAQDIHAAPRDAVDRAFSKQSLHYDEDDEVNPLLQDMRRQVYDHVDRFIRPNSSILELNAGTGIDALHFVRLGHRVHAVDIAGGMIDQIRLKKQTHKVDDQLTCQQLSFLSLDKLSVVHKFDYVFSNFGGLNCAPDLSVVREGMTPWLQRGAYVTWVIMPRVCPWEMLSVLKGNGTAFRRFNENGTIAHLEGEYFRTWYHSVSAIKRAMGPSFRLVSSEALGLLTPPPHVNWFPEKYPRTYSALRKLDKAIGRYFPFNRWGDHAIVTFRYEKGS